MLWEIRCLIYLRSTLAEEGIRPLVVDSRTGIDLNR